jgi:SPP1 family phage portal protein
LASNIIRRDAALRETLDTQGVPADVLRSCLAEHSKMIERWALLDKTYRGEHKILERPDAGSGRPNNKIVANHAKYITDMSVGYLLGDAIKYQSEQDLTELADRYKRAGVASVDPEIAKDMSIFGKAVELDYFSSDEEPIPKPAFIDPRCAFLVYDDTVECRPLFGVHLLAKYDAQGNRDHFDVRVYTPTYERPYKADSQLADPQAAGGPQPHQFSDIPLIEYPNNEERIGDFEPILSLNDAYNLLQSDRVNDVERFVQAILFLKGFSLGEENAGRLRTDRVLEAPTADPGVDAKWLVNALNQADVEVVRQTLEADIHKFAMVPELTDENFAGQASGVAMRYKLLGFDQAIKIKERYMEQGLRQRLRLFLSVPNWSNNIDPEKVDIVFTHSLPVNEVEVAQMVATLRGTVSSETLLGLLPFVKDAAAESKKATEEQAAALKRQQEAFGPYNDANAGDDEEE